MAAEDTPAPVLLWDFDGTLGYRDGGAWTATLLEVVQRRDPASLITMDEIRATLQSGFPWQEPEKPHPHLTSADVWWAALAPVLARAFEAVGFGEDAARVMAEEVRPTYLAYERWRLFDDVIPTLDALSDEGWAHILLTNHVPELPEILARLGVERRFRRVFNSAQMGYEKPHPRAFEMVIESTKGRRPAWMIGDNYTADIIGAAAFGIPGILVRRSHPEARLCAASLLEVPGIIRGAPATGGKP